MIIDMRKLKHKGYLINLDEDRIEIIAEQCRDITSELHEMTDLPMRDCRYLQTEIVDLQIMDAIRN